MLFPYQTAAITLGGVPVPRSNSFVSPVNATNTGFETAGRDYFIAFVPKCDIEIDEIQLFRKGGTAGACYAGIYDKDGILITDAPVQSVAGTDEWKGVAITPITLSAGELYYWCANVNGDHFNGISALGTYIFDSPSDYGPNSRPYTNRWYETRSHGPLRSSVDFNSSPWGGTSFGPAFRFVTV